MASADRLIEVFSEAKGRPAGAERERFLAERLKDEPELKEQVVSLLQAHDGAGDFLKNALVAVPQLVTENPGDKIGRYKLLQEIGEGGCGVVYMAEQEEPVRRRVALKVIKLGMDTKQVIARFEAERQALALMDHPNIAKVLDAGATDTGRPYFVMELVRGIQITDYCDQNNLSTEERLKLFTQVCQAIQHAHQKGIIHRDIKPSNILVTQHDCVAVPKVIDFGIAKATTGQLTEKTVFTAFEQFIGTPAYMSPEQAQMSGLDIDTRTDIYSLGVLLYELLSGKAPFDSQELLKAGLDEMRRTIREKQPLRPSTRLTQDLVAADARRLSSKSAIDGASSRRLLQKRRELIRLVRGDLDWIVMKCLEKDRTRRYETANGLAMDIHRHLNNEPVVARRPSRSYRFQKLVRRNKLVFAALGGIAALLVLVAVGSTVAAWRVGLARSAERAERQRAEAANRELRQTVSLLELQRAEDLFQSGDSADGVAHLAAILRRDPSHHIAASRLVSALVHRNWALPCAPPMRHANRVECAYFSPDGRHVLSASWDKTAQVWDSIMGQALFTLRHQDRLYCARYSADGRRIVTASADGTAQIWNATNGAALTPPLRHEGKVYWAEFSQDERFVVTASAHKTARIWDAASGALKQELRGDNQGVVVARFSPDSERVVTGTESGGVQFWSVESGRMLLRLDVHQGRINALAFTPDGRRLVSASEDGTARLWNPATGEPVGEPLVHKDKVNYAGFSPDSRLLLTASLDDAARLWDAESGHPAGLPPLVHEGGVRFGAFSSDGQMVVTTSNDNSARLWDVRTGMPLCQPLREHEAILHAGFSPDGLRLVTASYASIVQIWNIQPRRFVPVEMGHATPVKSAVFDPRGECLVTASLDKTARLWDARTGQPVGEPMRHEAEVQFAEFSADGRRVITASSDGAARVWEAPTGRMIAGPWRHAKGLWSARFSPDGERVVTASVDGTARVWDADTGQPLTPPLEHEGQVRVARFSPDGRFVVTASDDWSARVWNAQTGQPVTERLSHLDNVEWADFSPDSERVATASSDNTARVWEVRTGKPVGLPLRHPRTVLVVAFSPDGRVVVTGSLDQTARVWEARTGQALTPSLKHDSPVSRVGFSPDGQRILTASWNGTARLWDANTGRPLTEWLAADGLGTGACFDSTGRRIATGTQGGLVRVWDVPPVPVPVPAWFVEFAEVVAGIRLNERGNVELVPREELDKIAEKLAAKEQGEFYGRLARWFLAKPAKRALAPF